MAILITGSRGFIGSCLTGHLKTSGQDIIPFVGDISKRDQILDFQPGAEIETVIHLAGVIDKKNIDDFESINIEGTKNIIEFCRKNNVRQIIFLSSLKVLSRQSNPYIDSKREAEKVIIKSGIPYIILRPSMVYGPGDKKNIGFLLRLAKKLPFMPGFKFRMQLLFVDDLARIIMESLSLPPDQIINIAGSTVSYADLLKTAKELGCKFSVINWPNFFALTLKTAGWLGLSPMPAWQIDSLLNNEIFEEYGWHQIFSIKEIPLKEGISKILNQ